MGVRVQFRFNKLTGEVEQFIVDDQDRTLSEERHDEIATEVALLVAERPGIEPIASGVARAEARRVRPDDEREDRARDEGEKEPS
jgi:hypothetical protein